METHQARRHSARQTRPRVRIVGSEHRRRVAHDIRHELGTISLLANVLADGADVGPKSRQRALQLIGEARWLEELMNVYEDTGSAEAEVEAIEPVRLDELIESIVAPIRLSSTTRITVSADEVTVEQDQVGLWRALRNVVCNALHAAGPRGQLHIAASATEGFAVIVVHDDGPGLPDTAPTVESLGLPIVADLVTEWGGWLEIGRSPLGGCQVQLVVPRSGMPGLRSV